MAAEYERYTNGGSEVHIILNPGTGPVEDGDLIEAGKNIGAWLEDSPLVEMQARYNLDRTLENWDKYPDMKGRYTFDVTGKTADGREHNIEVDMPGLPLEQVRYLGLPGQDIWDFPRLYVAGSSWVWKYSFCEFDAEDED